MMSLANKIIRQPVFLLALFSAVLFSVFAALKNMPLISDEFFNYRSIVSIFKGGRPEVFMSTLPGYHYITGFILKIFTNTLPTLMTVRLMSVFFGIGLSVVILLVARKIDKKTSVITTFEVLFLPIIFPFYFVAYGDVLSLIIVILSFFCLLKKQNFLSGFFGVISLVVRQDNIFWLALFCLFIFLDQRCADKRTNWIKFFKRTWIFFAGFLTYAIFVLVNGGVAVGDKVSHVIGIYSGNIYFFLFIFLIFTLPFAVSLFPKIKRRIQENPLIILTIILAFVVFIMTFKVDHVYNIGRDFFLRNRVLHFFDAGLLEKFFYFIIVAYSVFLLLETKFWEKKYYLLYPAIILTLMPNSLVEVRYYFASMTLLILFRKKENLFLEYSIIGISILFDIFFFCAMYKHWFFF